MATKVECTYLFHTHLVNFESFDITTFLPIGRNPLKGANFHRPKDHLQEVSFQPLLFIVMFSTFAHASIWNPFHGYIFGPVIKYSKGTSIRSANLNNYANLPILYP